MPDNLQQASKASQFADKINNLGQFGTDVSEFSFDLTTIESIVGQFIESIKESIQSEDMPVTGAIEDIEMSIDEATGNIKVYGTEHLIYQDAGVKGSESSALSPDSPFAYTDKMPPVQVFIDWIKRKGINTINNEFFYGKAEFEELTEEEQIEKVAWGMAKNVYKNGFKPRNIYSKHIPDLVDNLTEHVAGFSANNITSMILNRYNENVGDKVNKGKKK